MRDVDAEVASVEGARDREALCVLDAAYEASAAFLDVAGLVAAAKAVDADRERAEALRVRAAALTKASLRPATELAQADAELAGAEGRAASLRRELRLAEARLADAMGVTEIPAIDPSPPRIVVGPDALDEHPQSRSAAKEITASEWRIASARTGYLPRLEIAAALWARGSAYPGAVGERLGESGSGLAPDVANWLVGAVVSWDVFDLPQTRARVARAHAEAAGTRARYDVVRLTLANQLGGARESASEAEVVVQRTAPAVEAARMALTQAEARYASGLVDFLDVARVRQLLTESELAHIAAEVALARSRILLARAAGDVGALTQER